MLGTPKFLSTTGGYYVIEHPGATRVLFAQSPDFLLEHLRYPRKIILALPESYFYYGRRDIEWKQHSVVTIAKLKQQIEKSHLEIELQYNAQLPYYNYSIHSITENSVQKSQLLGCSGSLQRTLQLSCLRPEYFYLLDIYTKQHIQVDIQLRCAAYLEKHAILSGIFLILDKHETHAILLEQGCVHAVHSLNTGYKDFYSILHDHHVTIEQLHDSELGTLQQRTIEESCKQFFEPITNRLSSLGNNTTCYLLSDLNKYQCIKNFRSNADLLETHQGFRSICPIQKHMYDELLLV